MDLLKSWAVGAAVWVVGSVITTALFVNLGSLQQIQSLTGRVLAFHLPALLVVLLAAALAALVHPHPQRADPNRHALAALAVPAVTVIIGLVNAAVRSSTMEVVAATILTGVLGGIIGWQLADLLRRSRS